MPAYLGKILWVDLDAHSCQEEIISPDIYAQFLSGVGLAAHILYEHIPAHADPLGPDNLLGFVSGLLTGTPSLFTGRWMAVAKSPLTGTWGEANCGGKFGMAIKQCGYDGIFFKGISPEPVCLAIGDNGPELWPASDLWGLDCVETERILCQRFNSKKQPLVACIGQAGENASLISGIVHDGGRMAARSGLGAVMGSKRLKAVVLQRSGRVSAADPQSMRTLTKHTQKITRKTIPLKPWMMPLFGKILRNRWVQFCLDGILVNSVIKKWGSAGFFQTFVEWDDAPIKNWSGSHRDFPNKQSKSLSIKKTSQFETKKYHCYACPTGCGGVINHPSLSHESHKPEYETINAFSALLLNNDFESVVLINDMLNRAGMDSISAGGTIAAAIEWFEAGLITTKQTDGLVLEWGNSNLVIQLVQQIIEQRGFGALLADGTRQAQIALGITRSDAAIHAGGQELAMHDSRLDPGYALHASVEPNPGRHTTGSFLYYDLYRLWKAIPALPKTPLLSFKKNYSHFDRADGIRGAANACYTNFYNGLGVCFYGACLGSDRLDLFELTNMACGWRLTAREYMQIGQRILTLKQLFNIKHGVEPASIKISKRALGLPPLKRGGNRGGSINLEELKRFYWQIIGYDPHTGIPTPETLHTLALSDRALALEMPAFSISQTEEVKNQINPPFHTNLIDRSNPK